MTARRRRSAPATAASVGGAVFVHRGGADADTADVDSGLDPAMIAVETVIPN